MSDKNPLLEPNYKLLYSREDINERLEKLAGQISIDYQGKKPILIGVLNGAFIFLADLIRHIDIDVEMDFIRISSYGNRRESSGHIKILKPLNADIAGRDVIVVEDIVDSGLSVKFLRDMLSAFEPKSLKFVTLLHKPEKTIADIEIDYVGFELKDKFVVGYGLDDAQLKRNLSEIYIIENES